MLNLVQLQERLKDVPMQALMQYANGTNPQVPPFLALGELNRRKKMQEGAAAEQAAEMEGAPTVKQQIEQATGLMALQGNRQRQAARQQAGIQAAMPMAAPNTTTSEPAQLAGGGFIDDIVVPRDYQRGGMVSPDMLKRLMMMKAMKRPGVSGLPMRPDMFKRGDYAGGGIVAFQGGGSTFAGFMPDEEERPAQRQEIIEVPFELIGKIGLAQLKDIQSGKYGRTKAEILAAFGMGEKPAQRLVSPTQVAEAPPAPTASVRPEAQRSAAPGIAGLPKELPEAIKRALNIDVSKEFPDRPERSFDQIMAEQRRRQGLMGISEAYLDEREKRLGDIQAKREAARAQQPMEQLTTFLTSIAEGPRGGTFGTQGARGAKASRELRAQQEALRDKQDMEMEELKFTVAAKRDAIRRGDMGSAEALEEKEKALRRDMAKIRAEQTIKQAELASLEGFRQRSLDVEGQKLNVMRDDANYNRAVTAANLEAERVRSDLRRRAEGMMDKNLTAQIKANPNYIDEQVEAARNRILKSFGFSALPSMGGAGSTAGGSVEVKLPNGRSMYFPNQEAANQFKQAAGIK